MKTQTEVRNAFWEAHPQYQAERRSRKRQNQYSTDIRCSFVDFVDYLSRNREISDALRNRVTL
jgi:hypothetical protein